MMVGAAFAALVSCALCLCRGDRAAREPWRMAAAALHELGWGERIPAWFPEHPRAQGLAGMLATGTRCPRTSSLGRLFDAAAGLLKVKAVSRFEGQAAMLLEGLAAEHGAVPAWEGAGRWIRRGSTFVPCLRS